MCHIHRTCYACGYVFAIAHSNAKSPYTLIYFFDQDIQKRWRKNELKKPSVKIVGHCVWVNFFKLERTQEKFSSSSELINALAATKAFPSSACRHIFQKRRSSFSKKVEKEDKTVRIFWGDYKFLFLWSLFVKRVSFLPLSIHFKIFRIHGSRIIRFSFLTWIKGKFWIPANLQFFGLLLSSFCI